MREAARGQVGKLALDSVFESSCACFGEGCYAKATSLAKLLLEGGEEMMWRWKINRIIGEHHPRKIKRKVCVCLSPSNISFSFV